MSGKKVVHLEELHFELWFWNVNRSLSRKEKDVQILRGREAWSSKPTETGESLGYSVLYFVAPLACCGTKPKQKDVPVKVYRSPIIPFLLLPAVIPTFPIAFFPHNLEIVKCYFIIGIKSWHSYIMNARYFFVSSLISLSYVKMYKRLVKLRKEVLVNVFRERTYKESPL